VGSLYLAFGPTVRRGAWVATLGAVAVTLGLLGSRRVHRWIVRLLARRGLIDAGWTIASPRRFAATWFGLHVVAWLAYGLAFCLLWAAFRPLPAGTHVLMVASAFPTAYVLGFLAFFAPAGVGVREGALAALTAPLLGAADATALAVIARVLMTVLELVPLIWIAIALWTRRRPQMGSIRG
jgi:hypothetical protein